MPLWCLVKKMASALLAPLLGLLLLCQSCGWNRKHPPTYGFLLDVATVPAPDPLAPMHYLCGDMRYIIATAAGNGRGSLNGETVFPETPTTRARLQPELTGAFYRRLIYAVAPRGRRPWSACKPFFATRTATLTRNAQLVDCLQRRGRRRRLQPHHRTWN